MEDNKTKRKKSETFSISMTQQEKMELTEYIEKLEDAHGFSVSRNQLITRAVIAHVRFMNSDGSKSYVEIFKGTRK